MMARWASAPDFIVAARTPISSPSMRSGTHFVMQVTRSASPPSQRRASIWWVRQDMTAPPPTPSTVTAHDPAARRLTSWLWSSFQ
ncbi:MAG: hypothetical protein NTV86_16330 [Planctomycetota bacterium]|nr:hypothetical protein [Planctomycetota bacterium]